MTIQDWLSSATNQLDDVGIPSGKLDAEIILAHTLRHSRTWIHAYNNEPLPSREHDIADARLDLRLQRVPIAYIVGHKEFYGRRFMVNPSVLVPRPESETIIDIIGELIAKTPAQDRHLKLIDIGTGSGALGTTAKLLHPSLDVTLLDISNHALNVARKNAKTLHAEVEIQTSDLLDNYPVKADYILANLPYVDKTWTDLSPETKHEPAVALFASEGGLDLIYRLIDSVAGSLNARGITILEADPTQHDHIIARAETAGLQLVETRDYCVVLQAK